MSSKKSNLLGRIWIRVVLRAVYRSGSGLPPPGSTALVLIDKYMASLDKSWYFSNVPQQLEI